MNTILNIIDLSKYFYINSGVLGFEKKIIKAVDNINLTINKGEILGLVGESGCGKTTLGRVILNLIKPDKGKIIFNNKDLSNLTKSENKKIKQKLQIIFQDPYSSLNPRLPIIEILTEALIYHKIIDKKDKLNKAYELLELVGLNKEYVYRYPHEFSGGQRQRINIARAFALNPEFIVCDEIVSALDVSIQSQILNLMLNLKKKFNTSYLFISHDLAVVKYISDYIAVMYAGEIIEYGKTNEIINNPLHPYTQILINSVPKINNNKNKFYNINNINETYNTNNNLTSCKFSNRCPYFSKDCKDIDKLKFSNNRYIKCCKGKKIC